MDCPLDSGDVKLFSEDITDAAADAMIATVWSRARKLAACLGDDDVELSDDDEEVVKGVLRAVVLRWAESGSGVVSQRVAGDYSETYKGAGTGGRFRPDEIRELQDVCRGLGGSVPTGQRAFSVDTSPYPVSTPAIHPFLQA